MIKKLFFAIAMLCTLTASADEGMWLVKEMDKAMLRTMHKMGLKLSADQIYSETGVSLHDAIVAVNGGQGSGSIVSSNGLMITNHHVAYSGICSITTPEHNYLQDGFWAKEQKEEIPVPGFSVQFLRAIKDVTEEATAIVDSMKQAGKFNSMSMRRVAAQMQKRYADVNGLTPSFEDMWRGQKYFIYFYEVYRDIRLVACPPDRIGAFGGDTDNWGWPQHKADFTVFRVYTDKDGKPAKYSEQNIPLQAKTWLKVGKSVREGDFTMVIGYPGRTNRYMSSACMNEKMQVRNPIVIDARHKRMDIIREGMESSQDVRLKYSDRYFGLSNYADYAKWENICFKRFDIKGKLQQREAKLQAWIDQDADRKAKYGNLLSELDRAYACRALPYADRLQYSERWFGVSECYSMASRMMSAVNRLKSKGEYMLDVNDASMAQFRKGFDKMAETDPVVERKLFVELGTSFFESVDAARIPKGVAARISEKGSARAMLEDAFDSSCCRSAEALKEFFKEPRRIKAIMNDPVVELVAAIPFPQFQRPVLVAEKKAGVSVSDLEKQYQTLLYEFYNATSRSQYPNANSTMRLTYGKVEPVSPRDGVEYSWYSTTNGYLEKVDATNHDFRPDQAMLSAVKGLDKPIMVDFITNNDITGGNSGSAVMNGRGEIVGLAFDGNRESMAGDVYFDSQYNRCVCVDINYVLFVIRQFAPQTAAEIGR